MMILSTNRNFRVWDALVSHDQLLLRSPTTGGYPTNIDIRFVGVEYVCIPMLFRGLTMRRGTEKEMAPIRTLTAELVTPEHLFILETEWRRHFIVAAHVHIEENDLDGMKSSLMQPQAYPPTQSP